MNTDVKPSWMASRMPCLGGWWAGLTTPSMAREAPYLAVLPWLITAGLVFLTASGLVLAVYYNPADAFASRQFIAREVNNGWLIEGFHATGTTLVFAAAYLLLLRGMLARSYRAPGELVWLLDIVAFALLLLVGWLGFALTGGAAGYWSVMNATNAAMLLPGALGALGTWFFGGPDGPGTLARLLVLHIALALVIFFILWLRHGAKKAATPLPAPALRVAFHPYYTAQYFVALVVSALIGCVLLFFYPHFGQSPLNNVPGGPLALATGAGVPWYLAPLAGLSALFHGTYGGILGLAAGLVLLLALPWLDRSGPGRRAGGLWRLLTWVLALDVLGLGWAACGAAGGLSGLLVVVFGAWYFLHFLVLTPIVTALEAQ